MSDKKMSEVGSNLSDPSGQMDNFKKLVSFAKDRFGTNDFTGTVDCCRRAIREEASLNNPESALEVYYLWCLACIKRGELDDAIAVCSEARDRFGNYLDIAYFELIVTSIKGELAEVPRMAEGYLRLWELASKDIEPGKTRTSDLIGQVLLMLGQALEQMKEPIDAIRIYQRYLGIFPEDKAIADRLAQMAAQAGLPLE